MPHIDCYTHMHNWLAHLQKQIPRPLEDDDYIFPGISPTGQLKFGEGPISRTAFETLMEDIVEDSGVLEGRNGKFTTHCFRRGGCQYRFMWAPVKWSLKAVKWWGGWSSNDNVGTIMRYLLDELMTYEENFGDIMMKTRPPNRHEMMDDRTEPNTPLTKAQCEAMFTQLFEKLSSTPLRPTYGEHQVENDSLCSSPRCFDSTQYPSRTTSYTSNCLPVHSHVLLESSSSASCRPVHFRVLLESSSPSSSRPAHTWSRSTYFASCQCPTSKCSSQDPHV
jgi:hypothetical protein